MCNTQLDETDNMLSHKDMKLAYNSMVKVN